MAVRTKAELENQINTLLADNTTGAISEGDVRSVFQDVADSLAFATQLRTDAQVNTLADARALARYTAAEKTKLAGVEDSATADQTGDEIVTLLDALTGNDRLDATAALRLIADAIDTELGNTDWRTGGGGTVTGAQIVTALQALMGDNRAHRLCPAPDCWRARRRARRYGLAIRRRLLWARPGAKHVRRHLDGG